MNAIFDGDNGSIFTGYLLDTMLGRDAILAQEERANAFQAKCDYWRMETGLGKLDISKDKQTHVYMINFVILMDSFHIHVIV